MTKLSVSLCVFVPLGVLSLQIRRRMTTAHHAAAPVTRGRGSPRPREPATSWRGERESSIIALVIWYGSRPAAEQA
jgi:hypothetical protein